MKMGLLLAALVSMLFVAEIRSYPMDGYADTGIRRLEQARLTQSGSLAGSRQPPGALLHTEQIVLGLRGQRFTVPDANQALGDEIVALLGDEAEFYSVALLDLTDPNKPVYAQHRDTHKQNVGSVGKVLAALGLFQALADFYPEVTERQQLLRSHDVVADRFAHSDHHTIRLFNVDSGELTRRSMQDGDIGSLWEYLDWTLSASSNSAASMVMREAMLLRYLERLYPVNSEAADKIFDELSSREKTELFQRTFWQPVTDAGLSLAEIRQGSFFTKGGQRAVSGGGVSYASGRSLVALMLQLEQGRLVDEWSSLELKRLLYATERRIRYASAPALNGAAVYFKSGSLYSCVPEEGFSCRSYRGNQRNYMNSLTVVEEVFGDVKVHYISVVLSNVLKKNAAESHQALGTKVHQLIKARHGL
ncbi:MAG: hypothetical protein V7696_15240 [Halioglobus sp.]